MLFMKRENYLSWDTYFMSIALITSFRSKDSKTQTGSCIVSDKNIILGVGYNGLPKGLDDNDKRFWGDRDDNDTINSKHSYVIHSEVNAILNSSQNLENSKIYVTSFPCSNCSKFIIQSGIKQIIYLNKKESSNPSVDLMLKEAKIKVINFNDLELRDKPFIQNILKLNSN